MGEVIKFLDVRAILPVMLSCRRLRDPARRLIGSQYELQSSEKYFVGSVSLVKWTLTVGGRLDYILCYCASHSGNLEVLQWLLKEFKNPIGWTTIISTYAAEGGQLEVLKWLKECYGSALLWDEWVCSSAAIGGHLHILKYLLESNDPPCPINVLSCAVNAAARSNLNILNWLRKKYDLSTEWDKINWDSLEVIARLPSPSRVCCSYYEHHHNDNNDAVG